MAILNKLLIICTFTGIAYTASAQPKELSIQEIGQTTLQFNWGELKDSEVTLEYGLTKDFELGRVDGLTLEGLSEATFYYVRASDDQQYFTSTQLFSTASKSSGDITVYFNQSVNNSASSLTDAIQVSAFEDTIIAYINSAQNTLDICNYNTGSLPIITAINNAEASGITVRYIAADNTGTNNFQLSNLSGSVPMIQRPDDGEVMHNKFMIIDADTPALATVVTGSVNHTNNSCHEDYNNLVIVEDQSLALAYELEFEEMWGSSGDLPNISNSRFGDAKLDNTPHTFNIGGIPVELYFSPSDGTTAQIEGAIQSANTDVQFALLTFTNNVLGDAVIAAHNSGVDTKGIIENVLFFGSEYNGLQNAGVDVYSHFTEPNIFHHKYAIVDANNISSDPLVVTGSHNWSNSAEDDFDENTLIIHNAEIANMYYEEFMARYAEVSGSSGISEHDLSLNVYPNPTNSVLTVQSDDQLIRISILNGLGQELLQFDSIDTMPFTINLTSLPDGVYFVNLKSDSGTVVQKIVKRGSL